MQFAQKDLVEFINFSVGYGHLKRQSAASRERGDNFLDEVPSKTQLHSHYDISSNTQIMARRRVKKRTHVGAKDATGGNKAGDKVPKSMVIRIGAGEVGTSISQLVKDMRQVMEPHTASRLKVCPLLTLLLHHSSDMES